MMASVLTPPATTAALIATRSLNRQSTTFSSSMVRDNFFRPDERHPSNRQYGKGATVATRTDPKLATMIGKPSSLHAGCLQHGFFRLVQNHYLSRASIGPFCEIEPVQTTCDTMAGNGKKSKKTKGKTLSLNNFLQETPGGPVNIPLRKSNLNWADEVEEDSYDAYESRASRQANIVLPTAPKAARGLEDYADNVPTEPPFLAYMSNLPFDVEEDEIAELLADLKIVNMRMPRGDKNEGSRLKGFGYVEFEDQNSLVEALAKSSCVLKGRRVRFEVATNSDSDRRRGGRMDMNRDRSDRPDVFTTGDWRSGGRKEPDQPERRGGYNRDREGGGGGFSRDREGGGGFSRDREGGGGFSRDRDGGGGFNRDRGEGGGSSDQPGAWRDNNDRPSFRNDRPSYREGDRPSFRDDRESRYGREDKPITRDGSTRERFDDGERRGGFGARSDGYGRRDAEYDRGGAGGAGGAELRTRPKLVLQPRSRPVENSQPADSAEEVVKPVAAVSAPVPAASIFGNAKPVDTMARERQIEERLAKMSNDADSRDGRRDDRRRDDSRSIRRGSPDGRRYSPEGRRASPDGHRTDRRNDDRKAPAARPPPPPKEKIEKRPPAKEQHERDMPKVKTPEPVNIETTNQYSFLDQDSD